MSKFSKKLSYKIGNRLFTRVNKNLKSFYKGMENIANISTNTSVFYPEIKKLNHIMNSFFKAPNLNLNPTNNLIPITFETEDGVKISALKYITNPDSKKWIVALHWFAGHKYWALYNAIPFIKLGYNVLVFDFRNHGSSDDSQYVTMGINESKDFRAAMKWLHENYNPETIGLIGSSMGGFVLNYSINLYADEFKKYNIKFGITDSFYGSISTLLLHTRNTWLKDFVKQKKSRKIIEDVINSQSKDTGVDWNNIDAFKYYDQGKLSYVFPMFYLHCRNDKVTPFDDSLKIFIKRSIHSRHDEILIYDVSKHCLWMKYHYNQTVYRWLKFENKIMKDNKATDYALKEMGITQKIINNNFNESTEMNTMYLNSTILEDHRDEKNKSK